MKIDRHTKTSTFAGNAMVRPILFAGLIISLLIPLPSMASSFGDTPTGTGIIVSDQWNNVSIGTAKSSFKENEGVFIVVDVKGSEAAGQNVEVQCTMDGAACPHTPSLNFGLMKQNDEKRSFFQLNFLEAGTHNIELILLDNGNETDSRTLPLDVADSPSADLLEAATGYEMVMGEGIPPWKFSIKGKAYYKKPAFTTVHLGNITGCTKYQLKVNFTQGRYKSQDILSEEQSVADGYNANAYVWLSHPAGTIPKKGTYTRTISIRYDDNSDFVPFKKGSSRVTFQ